MCAHSTPRALAYVDAQPPKRGVIKRTTGGSFARSWPPPLPRRRCRCVLLLLPIIVVLFLLLLCATFAYSVCACSRTYGASSRELGERHASCDTTLSVATTAADASACTYSRCCCCCLFCGCCECFNVLPPPLCCCCCCLLSFLKVGLPEAANNHYEIKWVSR